MTKSVMISIQPQHAVNILNGKKTLELRTWIPKGYVGWVYVYVTKGKRLSVVHDDENGKTYYYLNSNWGRSLNQDIPFKFWFDEYAELNPNNFFGENVIYYEQYDNRYPDEDIEQSGVIDVKFLEEITQVSLEDMQKYSKGKFIYAWHIKKLEIFARPKELSEFYRKVEFRWADTGYMNVGGEPIEYHELEKAPQRSVWVYTKEIEK